MNLRPREADKELDGCFRFKPRSNVEKVVDAYRKNYPLDSLPNSEAFSAHLLGRGVIIKKNIDFLQKKEKKNKDELMSSYEHEKLQKLEKLKHKNEPKMIKLKPQNLFPSFHDKTMFKAATEFQLG